MFTLTTLIWTHAAPCPPRGMTTMMPHHPHAEECHVHHCLHVHCHKVAVHVAQVDASPNRCRMSLMRCSTQMGMWCWIRIREASPQARCSAHAVRGKTQCAHPWEGSSQISPFSQFIPNKKDQLMCTKCPIYRVGQWLAKILFGSFPKGLAMIYLGPFSWGRPRYRIYL